MTTNIVNLANVQIKATPQHIVFRPDELTVVEELKRNGIFATPGSLTQYQWVDVVAWGCVIVECRTSNWRPSRKGFSWRVNPTKHDRGIQGDIVVLVCNWPKAKRTFHVFGIECPVFYHNGQIKQGIKWTPGTRGSARAFNEGVSTLTDDLMDEAQDAWWLIEEKRNLISDTLTAGEYDRTTNYFVSEPPANEKSKATTQQLDLFNLG